MRSHGGRFPPLTSALWAVILVAAAYLVTLCILEKRDFWTVDNSNKFLQLRAIVDSGYSDYSIPWLGSSLDRDLAYNPLGYPISQVRDGKLYSSYSPFFATVSSLPFRAFGFWGLYLLPAVSSILMLVGLARLAGSLSSRPWARSWAVLIAGLLTPVWFYSATFWEHAPAVCLCVWAVDCYVRFLRRRSWGHLLAGSALAAFAVYFRDELYLFCAVLLGAALLYARGRRLRTAALALAVMIVAIVPLWLFHWKTIGHPLGLHILPHVSTTASLGDHVQARPAVLYKLFAASHPTIWGSMLLASIFLLGFVVNPRLPRRAFVAAVPVCALVAVVCSLISLAGHFSEAGPIAWMLKSNSLFPVAPILILAFIRPRVAPGLRRDLPMRRWLWLVTLAYAIFFGLATPAVSSGGVHWGNRFVIGLYPLLAVLAAVNAAEWVARIRPRLAWAAAPVGLALLLSLAAQVYSIHLLREKKSFSFRLNQAIKTYDERIVVTDVWWAPQTLFSEFYDKAFFVTRSQDQFERLLRRIVTTGDARLVWITRPTDEGRLPGAVTIKDRHLRFFSLSFSRMAFSLRPQ